MTDRDALLCAVCEEPDRDLPRNIFADWCEDNGEPERAEFVRVQIEIARFGVTRRRVIAESCVIRRNEVLFTTNGVSAENGARGMAVDERIDLDVSESGLIAISGRGNKKMLHGVLVERVFGSSFEGKLDSESVEHPAETLRRRERELFRSCWKWFPAFLDQSQWYIDTQNMRTRHDYPDSAHKIQLGWNRGFISHVTCSWSDWIANVDRLLWEPPVRCRVCDGKGESCPDCFGTGWTRESMVDCPECSMHLPGHHGDGMIAREFQCEMCGERGKKGRSSGRVVRKFLPTMQPITELTLTDCPANIAVRKPMNFFVCRGGTTGWTSLKRG